MFTIEPASALASIWRATPAVCSLIILISLELPWACKIMFPPASIVDAPVVVVTCVAALSVLAPVTSMSKIPASICTSEAAFAFASRWKATPAVWAVVILISLAAPAVSIVIAPEVSISKATASKSKFPDPS